MLAKELAKANDLVVIFGRTNVGKSTLFNRLVEKNQALVSDIEGTTRDSNIGQVSWRGQTFTLVDTGGFMDLRFLADKKVTPENIDEHVQKQARGFITRAKAIIFLVDNKAGLLDDDRQMALILKKLLPDTKHVILAANKTDSPRLIPDASQFSKLSLGEPLPVSAATGSNTGDLLDLVMEKLPDKPPLEDAPDETINTCILGKPNVGKSSLLNAIIGYDRVIVSPEAHTTREPQDTDIEFLDRRIKLVDTAGIHKKWSKSGPLTKSGIEKSLQILKRSEIALLVVDIAEGLTKQEAILMSEIMDRQKSLILIANKWDLIEERDAKAYRSAIYARLPWAKFVPIIFMSAKNRTKINHLMQLIVDIDENRKLELSEKQLDNFIKKCIRKHKPTKGKGMKRPRIYKFKQVETDPPSFVVKIGSRESLAESYLGFVANELRNDFDLRGTPVKIWVDKGKRVHGQASHFAE